MADENNALVFKLRQQLEYYFSPQNLMKDIYLKSQMDNDQYVSVSVIANFSQIKQLTTDKTLLVDVLRSSPAVQVDETGEKVRAVPDKHCILILREIADSTSAKDIEQLFSSPNCPKFISCEFVYNKSWYVTFECDEDAKRAYQYLREEVKTFQGKPIMVRIKAKVLPATHYSTNGQPAPRAPYTPRQPAPVAHVQPVVSDAPLEQSVPSASAPPQSATTASAVVYGVPTTSQQNQTQSQRIYAENAVPAAAAVGFTTQPFPSPFYPPHMLQAWAPPATGCYDLSQVIKFNGLSPQVTFKPYVEQRDRQTNGAPPRYNGGGARNTRKNYNANGPRNLNQNQNGPAILQQASGGQMVISALVAQGGGPNVSASQQTHSAHYVVDQHNIVPANNVVVLTNGGEISAGHQHQHHQSQQPLLSQHPPVTSKSIESKSRHGGAATAPAPVTFGSIAAANIAPVPHVPYVSFAGSVSSSTSSMSQAPHSQQRVINAPRESDSKAAAVSDGPLLANGPPHPPQHMHHQTQHHPDRDRDHHDRRDRTSRKPKPSHHSMDEYLPAAMNGGAASRSHSDATVTNGDVSISKSPVPSANGHALPPRSGKGSSRGRATHRKREDVMSTGSSSDGAPNRSGYSSPGYRGRGGHGGRGDHESASGHSKSSGGNVQHADRTASSFDLEASEFPPLAPATMKPVTLSVGESIDEKLQAQGKGDTAVRCISEQVKQADAAVAAVTAASSVASAPVVASPPQPPVAIPPVSVGSLADIVKGARKDHQQTPMPPLPSTGAKETPRARDVSADNVSSSAAKNRGVEQNNDKENEKDKASQKASSPLAVQQPLCMADIVRGGPGKRACDGAN